jgi:hypothetical protein
MVLAVGIFGWLSRLVGLAMEMSSVTVVGNPTLVGRFNPSLQPEKKVQEENQENKSNPASNTGQDQKVFCIEVS